MNIKNMEKNKVIVVRISEDDKELIRTEAKESRVSMSSFVVNKVINSIKKGN